MGHWWCIICLKNALPFCAIDDDEFRDVVYCQQYERILDFSQLDKLVFNPFELNDKYELPMCDLDPDIQFFSDPRFSNNNNCDYHTQDTFNRCLVDRNSSLRNGLSIYLHNIKSICKHYTELQTMLNGLSFEFDVIGITETWLSESSADLYSIPGYQDPHHSYRTARKGGGVSLYVKENIQFTVRNDIAVNDGSTENIFIEIDKGVYNTSKDVLIGLIYRPPNTSMLNFNKELENTLHTISRENKIIYLLGDYNINLLNTDLHAQTSNFIDILYSHHLFPLITKPTRSVGGRGTLIDNIFTNDFHESFKHCQGLLYCDISDHLPVFHINTSMTISLPKDMYIWQRKYSDSSKCEFANACKNINWENVLIQNDAQIAYSQFRSNILTLYDRFFPSQKVKHTVYKCRQPWLTTALKTSIKIKNKLYIKQLRHSTNNNIELYKTYINN